MVKVISDTSFLIHLATHRIKNIDSIETEIGTLSFIVPKIVKKELEHLAGDPEKKIRQAANRLKGEFTTGSQEHFALEGQVSFCLLYTSPSPRD